MEGFIGMIQGFGFAFAPVQWAHCSGATMQISQNQALYSLIGSLYGGDGRVTFALPDLRARTPIGSTVMGMGPGLPPFPLGTMTGHEAVSLGVANLPPHTHDGSFTPTGGGTAPDVQVSQSPGTTKTPASGDYLASAPALGTTFNLYVDPANAGSTVSLGGVTGGGVSTGVVTISNTGGGQAFSVLNPFTAITFSIATLGLYPSRN